MNLRILVPAAVMLFLVVAGLLSYWDQIIKGVATTGTTPEPTEVVPEEPTTAEETTGPPQEENGVRVVVRVVGARAVGLTILEDGQLVYDQVTTPGFSEEFQAEEAITVNAAEGDAVQVGVNGENPEPLGTSGEWTTRTFTAESQS